LIDLEIANLEIARRDVARSISPATSGEGWGKRWKELLFHQSLALVACYDGTMRRDEINRQCTPAHLGV